MQPSDYCELTCAQCANAEKLDFDFTFAFQPIVDTRRQRIWSYEALVRGKGGEGAGHVFTHVNSSNLYRFDQACRVKAISLAVRLGLTDTDANLSLNFTPNAVYRPELCIRTTLAAAKENGFPTERIMFEVTEAEEVRDHAHLVNIIDHYRSRGFITAIDDFGAGYSGLNLLAEYQPDILKLDRQLIMGIHTDRARKAIVNGISLTARELGITLLAEGVEEREEYLWLAEAGIHLIQGFYFARPGFEALPEVDPALF